MKQTSDEPDTRSLTQDLRLSHLISMSGTQSIPVFLPAHGVGAKHDLMTKRRLVAILTEVLSLLDGDDKGAPEDIS